MENEDLVLIDKPKGISSFDVIRQLRKKLGVRKMGHAGTLDPLASGLMIIGVGAGTKQLKDLIGLDKEYKAEVLLGISTETGDMEGEVCAQAKIERLQKIGQEEIEKVLENMCGVLELPVPIYSAIKRGGEPLYKKARRGEQVDAPIKKMTVQEIKLLGMSTYEKMPVVKIRVAVSSGTYIRSLAEEIGRRLGVPATIKELRRTKVGEFDIKDATPIYE